MHTLLYLKWVINKDLLYGTGNTVQCYVLITTNSWEKNLKKNIYMYIYIYVYICESLCCTPATNTTLLIYIKLYSNIKLKVSQKSVIPREKPLV